MFGCGFGPPLEGPGVAYRKRGVAGCGFGPPLEGPGVAYRKRGVRREQTSIIVCVRPPCLRARGWIDDIEYKAPRPSIEGGKPRKRYSDY